MLNWLFIAILQLDLPFSIVFYRWMLGQEHSLSIADLADVVPAIHATLIRMHRIVKIRDEILADSSLSYSDKLVQVCKIYNSQNHFIYPHLLFRWRN